MDPRTALEVLGLQGPADAPAVKAAYRRLARDQHPDAGGDVGSFQALQAAYEALRGGTDVTVGGPGPQAHAPAVDARWWEAPGAWHDEPVDHTGVAPREPAPGARVVRADVDLVAGLALGAHDGWRLVSRAPGSWLNRTVAMLDQELVCSLTAAPDEGGTRPGHDVVVRLRAPGGRGRRTAAAAALPTGFVRVRGTDVVQLERRLRPSRQPRDTAVRVARAVEELCDALEWPLGQWSLVQESPTT